MMRTSLSLIIVAAVALLLAACGQKGDLYLSDTLAKKEAAKEGMVEKAAQ